MAVAQGYGKTVTSGSVFAYDTRDIVNSYSGRPTVNVSAGLGLTNYNNVPGNVSTSITTTGETYKGAAVYAQTITPLDATGVSYLTNGNNPGIGVYHGGGGGTGGQYSGHTIFFKPVGPMHSSPIFTHYSNIGGWQSSTNYEDMGDGWFRAKVLWYSASTLSDQKFWAINPSGATANVPITIYWAGPFKENLNSTTISQFVEGTRSATQGLLPLVGNSSLDLSNVSFDSNAQMAFDGTNDYLPTSNSSLIHGTSDWTYSAILKFAGTPGEGTVFENGSWTSCLLIRFQTNGFAIYSMGSYWGFFNFVPTLGVWYSFDFIRNGNVVNFYVNGAFSQQLSFTANVQPSSNLYIGMSQHAPGQCFNGNIPVAKIYNRGLSAGEVRQNYLHYKTRFNLS